MPKAKDDQIARTLGPTTDEWESTLEFAEETLAQVRRRVVQLEAVIRNLHRDRAAGDRTPLQKALELLAEIRAEREQGLLPPNRILKQGEPPTR